MICENLLSLRRLHHYTQEDVAAKLGVSRQAVAKWEAGETFPDIENCTALAQLYGVTLDGLVHYDAAQSVLPLPPAGKHLFGAVKVGDKGQIVIPKAARDIFHICPGDNLLILGDEARGIAIIKADDVLNFLHHIQKGEDIE
ncbi:MAG: helix-turn-helix transcriptional regulator [Faecalibacterium sp.]|nr:helix-turn-helix transcriptional regulator [Faecalibacterium sp.]